MATILGIAPIVGATPEFMRQQQALVMQLLGVTPYEASGKDIFMQLKVIEQRQVFYPGLSRLFARTKKTKHIAWQFALGEKNCFGSPRLVVVAKIPDIDFANPGILCLRWYRRNAPKHLG
ncbi:MAG TPA: hypothetical protein VLB83_02065 [Candidatus Paceibacterota bacterium]|nr:hypothetical protein [Candidatus Paceibacterota bacterium]